MDPEAERALAFIRGCCTGLAALVAALSLVLLLTVVWGVLGAFVMVDATSGDNETQCMSARSYFWALAVLTYVNAFCCEGTAITDIVCYRRKYKELGARRAAARDRRAPEAPACRGLEPAPAAPTLADLEIVSEHGP